MNDKECQFNEIQYLIQEYMDTLSSPFDSFYEEHVIRSTFYSLSLESQEIGYYAIHNQQLLTQFYIRPAYLKHAQKIFAEVLESRDLKSLFVPTCDELFLSLAVDMETFTLNKQAYFFQDSLAAISESSSGNIIFDLATAKDLPLIKLVCGDFLEDQYDGMQGKGELFTYYRESELLGIGVMQKSTLLLGYASIGMFTNEQFRKQGIGRDIIIRLKAWCYNHQLKPICGCWYYNEASKCTLESAGMVTRTRLLRFDHI
jgi:GNAT superfamily N-acetyltransferase